MNGTNFDAEIPPVIPPNLFCSTLLGGGNLASGRQRLNWPEIPPEIPSRPGRCSTYDRVLFCTWRIGVVSIFALARFEILLAAPLLGGNHAIQH